MEDHSAGEQMADDTPLVRGPETRKAAMAKRPASTPTQPRVTPQRIEMMEKRRRAVELRKAGSTYDQIAQAVGYADASGARKAVMAAMEDITQEPAMELRKLNVERLNHMLLVLWPKVQGGDERAIDSGLRILDKLDKLMGTEAGVQMDINVNHAGAVLYVEGDKDAYIAAMKRMAGITQDGTNIPIEAHAVEDQPERLSLDAPTPVAVEAVVGVDDPGVRPPVVSSGASVPAPPTTAVPSPRFKVIADE